MRAGCIFSYLRESLRFQERQIYLFVLSPSAPIRKLVDKHVSTLSPPHAPPPSPPPHTHTHPRHTHIHTWEWGHFQVRQLVNLFCLPSKRLSKSKEQIHSFLDFTTSEEVHVWCAGKQTASHKSYLSYERNSRKSNKCIQSKLTGWHFISFFVGRGAGRGCFLFFFYRQK